MSLFLYFFQGSYTGRTGKEEKHKPVCILILYIPVCYVCLQKKNCDDDGDGDDPLAFKGPHVLRMSRNFSLGLFSLPKVPQNWLKRMGSQFSG